jgi:membrane protease YdiL (CAAX protease family)
MAVNLAVDSAVPQLMTALQPILTGLAIAAAGLGPWTLLARWNVATRPDLPWAALVTLAYLAAGIAWLNGWGPPKRTAAMRRVRLQLRGTPSQTDGLPAGALVAMLIGLYLMWILIARFSPMPDLNELPTTSLRWSMFLMGGLMAGVVEEVAFRGYMLSGLTKGNPANAVMITSAVFALAHITQGLGALLLLGPGLFAASLVFCALTQRTGSILPGILIHVLGDLSHVYFGVLRGDWRLLFT